MSPNPAHRPVAYWLFACCFLVFCMLVVGGVTRLTHSGLSIVEWKPLVGTLPPLTPEAWQETFAKYQQTPEFKLVNHQMDLDEFKGIFWWEYFHRLLGRGIGIAFALPLIWFVARRVIDRPLAWKLAGIFILGGLQGAMGWYMVKSGLVDDPRVSQYRLTVHLSLAFVIFAAMFWTALGLLQPRSAVPPAPIFARLNRLGMVLVGTVIWMIVTGGFVAGIRAGKAYNTFPLMNGHFVPPEIFMLDPWYLNFFNNMATVQFDHRLGAWLLTGLVPWLFWRAHRDLPGTTICHAAATVFALVVVQISLGITTLLHAVPVALGAAHQGTAMLVFAAVLWLLHSLRVAPGTVPKTAPKTAPAA
jgi:cytochrome c oxidase assembly protein subunit 15